MKTNDFDHMTTKDLRELQVERFDAARKSGIFGKLALIARELGWDPASRDKEGNPTGMESDYGPKFRWEHEDVVIYVDDYVRYMTVRENGKRVLSTHATDLVFIPGAWADAVMPFYDDAVVARGERLAKRDEADRQRALARVR